MKFKSKFLASAAMASALAFTVPAIAQEADIANADPACVITNADGTKALDTVKCKDGKPMAANQTTTPPADGTTTATQPAPADGTTTATQPAPADGTTTATQPAPADGTTTATQPAPADGTTTATQPAPADATTTASTSGSSLIVAPEAMAGARIMTASDFIGKRVYSKAGDDIGEVNDLFVTDKGNVQAVVLGVGGFLGMGEKDVAVAMNAIEMVQDGNAVRLVVDATKDQLQSAPAYDRAKRTYITN